MKKLGFIGYGLRSLTMMQAFRDLEAEITVVGIVDPREEEIKKEIKDDPYFETTQFYPTISALLEQELDGVFIGTRCSLHTEQARQVLATDIPLFLEKPVAISFEQYKKLKKAGEGKEDHVVVSFPLRVSTIVQEVKKIIDSGQLGDITMVQAINNVPYGRVYYKSWYRDTSETGGLFLQKTTHDIDYICYLLGEYPDQVAAKKATTYYKGDKPFDLTCPVCPEQKTCPESNYYIERILLESNPGDGCAFTSTPQNEDIASAIFSTPSGKIISYNQNFIAKKSAGRRGAHFIGTKGSVEFDFYTSEIRVDSYEIPQTVIHSVGPITTMHFGGDRALALDFMQVMEGAPAAADLTAGLASTICCLSAKQSAETNQFVAIEY